MTNLFRDMQRQWDHDGHSRPARAALAQWAERQPGLGRFATPGDLVAGAHCRSDVAARLLVDSLTEEAATDAWAARTVLQALLPGLARLTRDNTDMIGHTGQPFTSIDELDQFLVCTAFERITQVAAEVPQFRLRTILDSTWARLRSHAKCHRREQAPKLPLVDVAAAPPSRTEAEQLATILVDAVERQVLRRVDAALVYTTRVAGHPVPQLAATLEWPVFKLYQRRHRSEAVLIAEDLGQDRPRHCLSSA